MSEQQAQALRSTGGVGYITISVRDLDDALSFWVDRMGFQVLRRIQSADDCMATLWGVEPADIAEQVLLTSPGAAAGRIHLVRFAKPGEAVRANAAPIDLGPKNLDITCTGMHAHVEALKAAGFSFRSEIGEYTLDKLHAREVQMPCHDDTNMVFIEVLSEAPEFQVPFSHKGFAGVTSFVVVVPDTAPEANFYRTLFGWEELLHHRVSGPEIEAVVGLPPGAALELRMMGKPDEPFGRMELVSYERLPGENRFARTQPFATGVIACGCVVESLDDTIAVLAQEGLTVGAVIEGETLLGSGRVVRAQSPAGMKLDLLEVSAG